MHYITQVIQRCYYRLVPRDLYAGTLVVALVRERGIFLAADSRRGGMYDDAHKLVQLGPNTIAAIRYGGQPVYFESGCRIKCGKRESGVDIV
jgi:hypothetical protein